MFVRQFCLDGAFGGDKSTLSQPRIAGGAFEPSHTQLFEEPWSCLVERVVSSLSLSHFQFPTSSVEWISFTFLLATEFYCLLTVGDADNKVGEGNPSDLLRLSKRQGSQ